LDLLAALFHRADERRVLCVDRPLDGDDAHFLLIWKHFRIQQAGLRTVGIDDTKEAVGVDLVLELAE
jgi:hypothetical protein